MTPRTLVRTAAVLVLLAAGAGVAGCSGPAKSSSSSQRGPAARPPAVAQGNPPGAAPGYAPTAQPVPDGFAAGDRAGSGAAYPTEVDPRERPQSTFAMDVDTASYGFASAQIRRGERPDPQDVRPEEFVNAFRQDYPQPSGDGFAVHVDGARLPDTHHVAPAGDVRLMRVGLQTRAESAAQRPDAALTFVIDVSGSMGEPGKLDLVKQAMHTMVDQLRPSDSVAIVTFSERARVLRSMTPVNRRADLHAAIDDLSAGGSTNLEDGLVQGYRVAREGFRDGATNRVVLMSDGLANVGDTAAAPILDRVRDEAAKQITLFGVGVGSDYGDTLMEQLADRGDGYVVYVSELAQARRAFVEQLPATPPIRALDAKVQVTFDPGTVAGYRLIGYDDRLLPASAFRSDRVDGGEVAAGYTVTALYTVRLREGADGTVAQARIRWQDPTDREAHEQAATVAVTDLDSPFASAAPRLQVCYAAAYFAEVLRRSPFGRQVGTGDLARIAATAAGRLDDPAVADLADLIRRAGD